MSTYLLISGVIAHLWILAGLAGWVWDAVKDRSVTKADVYALPIALLLGPITIWIVREGEKL